MKETELLINNPKSNNSEDMSNKQIEEMTEVFEKRCYRDCIASCSECMAQTLYNAGYRKQSENTIELPCAIGTTIYELCYEKEDPCSWCEHDHSGFGEYICDFDYDPYPQVKDLLSGKVICPKNEMKVCEIKFDLAFYHHDKDWFNITWFLTKEEAETALAKMKGGAE